MNIMSGMRRDFVASHLRGELTRMHNVLGSIEEEEKVDCEYACETLRDIETNLRKIRKLCLNN